MEKIKEIKEICERIDKEQTHKIIVLNQDLIDLVDKYDSFDNFKFNLLIEDSEKKCELMSIAEIHAHFIRLAIDYIETGEFFDDYDDFIVTSRSYFKTNDGETLTYNVDISLEREN